MTDVLSVLTKNDYSIRRKETRNGMRQSSVKPIRKSTGSFRRG